MRPAAEAMVEALLVVDVEARRLLVVERAAGLALAPGPLQLHAAPDQRGQRGPGAQLVEKGGERVTVPLPLAGGVGGGQSRARSMLDDAVDFQTSLFQNRMTR